MSDNEIMKQWKKSSIVIGSPTNREYEKISVNKILL